MNHPLPDVAAAVDALADRIDAILPQTQCGRCGYPACRPYAEAIAHGEAPINRCPPGGEAGVRALAGLTGQPVVPLDPAFGAELPPRVALIDEDACIGCTKCIQACPVDAIVGAGKLMHTVVTDLCTGCELCVAPCPVDCITMVPAPEATIRAVPVLDNPARADAARTRFLARNARLARERDGRTVRRTASAATPAAPARTITRSEVLAAIARGRAKRARPSPARDATHRSGTAP